MKNHIRHAGRWLGMLALVLATGLMCGCDDEDYNHDPPVGQGAIVVDNYTGDRVYVYINGREEGSVGGDNHEYYDREPGLYRVALDGDDSHRSWAADVDVLEGRLTVLKVRGYSGDYDHFDVEVYFD